MSLVFLLKMMQSSTNPLTQFRQGYLYYISITFRIVEAKWLKIQCYATKRRCQTQVDYIFSIMICRRTKCNRILLFSEIAITKLTVLLSEREIEFDFEAMIWSFLWILIQNKHCNFSKAKNAKRWQIYNKFNGIFQIH